MVIFEPGEYTQQNYVRAQLIALVTSLLYHTITQGLYPLHPTLRHHDFFHTSTRCMQTETQYSISLRPFNLYSAAYLVPHAPHAARDSRVPPDGSATRDVCCLCSTCVGPMHTSRQGNLSPHGLERAREVRRRKTDLSDVFEPVV